MRTTWIAAAISTLALAGCITPPAPPSGPWLDFATMQEGKSPNSALACGPELCPRAPSSRDALAFDASAERVVAALQRLEPSVQVQTEPSGDIRARYVAITPLMRFRDDVDVLIHPASAEQTHVAVYSRSRIGLSDLGANAARIEALDARLRAELAR
jgi:hypothetical protein